MSSAVDTSTNATDLVQLLVFVRNLNREIFKKELLFLLQLKTNTTGESMSTAMKGFFEKNSLILGKISLVVSDGMRRGFASHLIAGTPDSQLATLH